MLHPSKLTHPLEMGEEEEEEEEKEGKEEEEEKGDE